MNKTDFILACAEVAGWKIGDDIIQCPVDQERFNASGLSTGFAEPDHIDKWHKSYKPMMMLHAILNLNNRHNLGLNKIMINILPEGTLVIGPDRIQLSSAIKTDIRNTFEGAMRSYFEMGGKVCP